MRKRISLEQNQSYVLKTGVSHAGFARCDELLARVREYESECEQNEILGLRAVCIKLMKKELSEDSLSVRG